ncbi:hypothetical protein [Vibrio hepatarius]|uniref:hypothetical protein n=1 Tax=Vibrio hepatarius TaxID=171383 RepID=UPI001C0928AB|nr:hypothetical protein [Vibrio hepatarius]MBU2895885.1 hypothetical protein [Vibrio hepatarius]
MSEVNFGVSPTVTALESSNDMETVIAQSSPVVKRAAAANTESTASTSQSLFSPGFSDPLDLIDDLLSTYIASQTASAQELADEIEKKSDAIAEINRLWGQIMIDGLDNKDPDDFGPAKEGTTNIYDHDGDKKQDSAYAEIDKIICELEGLPDPDPDGDGVTNGTGIAYITGGDNHPTYDQLQEMNAKMTAYCDKIQVELDTQQQEFKNMMTEVSSAQEELRDVRRSVVSMSQQG